MISPPFPESRSAVSSYLLDHLGGDSPTVRAYYDEDGSTAVAVVEAPGAPHPELTAYATASLHATSNYLDGTDIRVELLLVGLRNDDALGNVLATAAFLFMKQGWLVAPGVVFRSVIAEYFPETTTPHLMWSGPLDFGELAAFKVAGVGMSIHAIQGVPISDVEHAYLMSHGFDELNRVLERASAPYFDLHRDSVV